MPPPQPPVPSLAGRRADAGTVKLTGRDITGLMLCADHYAAPYDLLAAALDVRGDRLRGIVARWRHIGYAETGTLGPGPAWCWLTPAGMKATGLSYPATRPALGRIAHIRAVLAVRLWLQASEVYTNGRAWWRSERRIRAALGGRVGIAHIPDAEVHWPSLDGSPYAGQVWAIEAELTPKPLARTVTIMRGLLARTSDYGPGAATAHGPRYGQVVYLTAPAARPVVTRAVDALPAPLQPRHRGPRPATGSRLVSIWSWLKLTAALWLIRKGFKVVGWLLVAAAAIAAWPLTAVAALGYLAAWLRGWPPSRLWHAAAWALPMTAVYAIGEALRLRAWQAVALAPVNDWANAWGLLAAHAILRAGLLIAPVAVPAGLAIAGVLWAWRIYAITTGLAGLTAVRPDRVRRPAMAAAGTRRTWPGRRPRFGSRC